MTPWFAFYTFKPIDLSMDKSREKVSLKIVNWYEINGRKDLPWRKTKNSYKVLIAELMLQRTHAIKQVLPVFNEFIDKYPDIESLSKASITEIRETIFSLGLHNTRSRRMKELATKVKEHFTEIPKQRKDLISLPGVGEYVANAVLCMAFDKPYPMVDSNFGRVLGRVFFGKEEYPPSKNRIWKTASGLLPDKNYKEFNLGVMDLGALVCTPKNPVHSNCPLSEECMFYKNEGIMDE